MLVHVSLHGILVRYLPDSTAGPRLDLSLPAAATVREAVAALGLLEAYVALASVNRKRARLDSPLQDGDRLTLFPPVVGG
ncbi:MAG: MoaD/ThiS family protein [Bacillota bacterium]